MKNKITSIISDDNIANHWKCPECGEAVTITPDFYQNNGTPMCIECDEDMEYTHSEVTLEN